MRYKNNDKFVLPFKNLQIKHTKTNKIKTPRTKVKEGPTPRNKPRKKWMDNIQENCS